ncbi:MAG: NAD-glutamate dehydrogenase domain-containing protein, partial [bacterium]
DLDRSSWADYDPGLISPGGGVFSRSRKSIPLSPAAQRALGLDREQATPVEVIRAILTAPADLLWFGGIGTYVKASAESNFQVGDPSNDQVRVNADELRVRVIGEGANLGCTQRGRIEYARHGGRINTDAVDNAAGVDCSDHEVNIKIALDNAVRAGRLDMAARNALLARMTEDVAALVLNDNYRQTLALTLAEATAPADIDAHGRFMRILERKRLLDRKVEFLPDDEALQELKDRGQGLTRPELSVLLAYSKITLFDELVDSALPDDSYLEAELMRYFPDVLSGEFPKDIARHRLRREIIATTLANDVVNTGGLTFVNRTRENLGHSAPDIVRCYVAARELFELRALRTGINALDLVLPASVQTRLHLSVIDFLRSQVLWFLRYCAETVQISEVVDHYAEGLDILRAGIRRVLTDFERQRYEKRLRDWMAAGVPEELAARVTVLTPLASACDIVDIAAAHGWPVEHAARAYFRMGELLGLDRLRAAAFELTSAEHWERLSIKRSVEELFRQQRELTAAAISQAPRVHDGNGDSAVDLWVEGHREAVERATSLILEMDAAGPLTGAKLSLAATQMRELCRNSADPDSASGQAA